MVIYQESLHDVRWTKCKKWIQCIHTPLTYILILPCTLHIVLYKCVITSKTQARYNSCLNLHASHSLVKIFSIIRIQNFVCVELIDYRLRLRSLRMSLLSARTILLVRYIGSCDVSPIKFSLCLQITSFPDFFCLVSYMLLCGTRPSARVRSCLWALNKRGRFCVLFLPVDRSEHLVGQNGIE